MKIKIVPILMLLIWVDLVSAKETSASKTGIVSYLETMAEAGRSAGRMASEILPEEEDWKDPNKLLRWGDTVLSEFGCGHPVTNEVYQYLGDRLFLLGHYLEAHTSWEVAAASLKAKNGIKDRKTLEALGNLAHLKYEIGHPLEALDIFLVVLSLRERILGRTHLDTIDTKSSIAALMGMLGNLTEARILEEEVLDARTHLLGPEHRDTLTAIVNLAETLRAMGHLSDARKLEEEVLRTRVNTLGHEHSDTLLIKNNFAATLKALGNLEQALQVQEDVWETRCRLLGPSHPETLVAGANLADTLHALGKVTRALRMEREVARDRSRVLGSFHPDTLVSKNNLASTLFDLGNLAEARQLEEEVVDGLTEVLGPDHLKTITAKTNLAATHRQLGNLAEALKLEKEAVYHLEKSLGNMHPDTSRARANLAATLYAMGNFDQARMLFEEVLRLWEVELGFEHPQTLTVKSNLANVLRASGDKERAVLLFEELLETRKKVFGQHHLDVRSAVHNLGWMLFEMGQPQKARYLLRGSLQGYLVNSSDDYQSTELTVDSLWLLARIEREFGHLQEADVIFEKVLESIEHQASQFDLDEETQSRFRREKGQAFYQSIALDLTRNDPESAFKVLERFRSNDIHIVDLAQRTHLDVAREDKLEANKGQYDVAISSLLVQHPVEDKIQYDKTISEQIRLRRERAIILGRVAQERLEARPQPLTAKATQQILDADTALLAFGLGEEELHGFVLTRENLHAFKIEVTPDDLNRQVLQVGLQLQENPRQADQGNLSKKAAWLTRKLIEPAWEHLKAKKRWLVLPDGVLHYLPFAMLARPGPATDGHAWMAEDRAIHIVQSATLYNELIKRRPAPSASSRDALQWIGFGNPTYNGAQEDRQSADDAKGVASSSTSSQEAPLPSLRKEAVDSDERWAEMTRDIRRVGYPTSMAPLPNTEREIQAIARLFKQDGHRHEVFFAENATEDKLHRDLRGVQYIHIATHGVSFPNQPQKGLHPSDSFIALSLFPEEARERRGLEQNGLLQAWEIANHLKLDAELVVLSACETAIGENRGGEGLMSLARAFLQAGARSVLASLWKVDDLSTSELMIRFYRHLLDGESKVDALRLAQIELASGPIKVEIDGEMVEKDFTAPYYWAGFQLIGDWQ